MEIYKKIIYSVVKLINKVGIPIISPYFMKFLNVKLTELNVK